MEYLKKISVSFGFAAVLFIALASCKISSGGSGGDSDTKATASVQVTFNGSDISLSCDDTDPEKLLITGFFFVNVCC